MNHRTRVILAVGLTVALFLGVQLGALALVEPFQEAGHQAVEDPDDPTNSLVYFGIILVATGFMLLVFRYDVDWLIKALIVGVSVMLSWFVFAELVPPVVTVGSVNAIAVAGALAFGAALYWYPEWYVIDATGVVMGAGAAALFGISFGLLPAILLLAVLAVYDAISVYGTEHMLDLAEGVMDLKIPVVLVVPTTLSFSYLEDDGAADSLEENGESSSEEPEDRHTDVADRRTAPDAAHEDDSAPAAESDEIDPQRDALFIGLGDAVIPSILVVSAAFFLEAGTIDVPGIALNLAALGSIVGTIAGLLVLMYMVLKGRPHAGLPLLNGGAIGGYLIGALASGLSLTAALGF
ncbi:presenilin family intramembrane aspartyl protease PSH [Natronolimnohabitans sp. A-GB9]|uniref:presenilin family intramembrane aspartyl protease PSH n=1 Tax=Natronolimnohabitans sp. A-GB9 TaxID=3069757 RepID=UPI0027B20A55|nr:presenilin family intramembrane aspartyl protease PSH [Natronolimnohabitans sp. A-GB9]MDQ2052282.1 presenilin family intramembrane aspartyl protease PSH [Natronolimnohabitans sp. A-GB9]